MPKFEEIQKNILLLKVPFSGLWTAIRGGIEKTGILYEYRFYYLAEQEGFEPSVPFWGTHDFQSCPL